MQVAIDGVFGHQRIEMVARVDRDTPQMLWVVAADFPFKPVLRLAHADVHLAAVSARCAPADRAGFEQHGVDPPLCEAQRGAKPTVAAADDANFGFAGTFEG